MLNFHQRAMHERKFFMKLNSLPFSPKVSEALRCSSNCEGFTPWGKKLFWKWCWYCSNAVRFSALHFRLAAMLLSPQAYGGDWLPPPLLMGLAKSLEYSSANLPHRPDWKNLHQLCETGAIEAQLKALLKPLRRSQHYLYWGFKGGTHLVFHCAERCQSLGMPV